MVSLEEKEVLISKVPNVAQNGTVSTSPDIIGIFWAWY